MIPALSKIKKQPPVATNNGGHTHSVSNTTTHSTSSQFNRIPTKPSPLPPPASTNPNSNTNSNSNLKPKPLKQHNHIKQATEHHQATKQVHLEQIITSIDHHIMDTVNINHQSVKQWTEKM